VKRGGFAIQRDLHLSFFIYCNVLFVLVGQEGEFIAVRRKKQAKHTITHEFIMLYYRKQPIKMVIEKSESVMLRLKEIADIGFHHRR
jgi:hypothetical protein